MEPFQQVMTINQYRRRLGMCLANANCNGKIWYFVAVYAKCSASERIELWEDFYHLSNTLSCSWLVGGDFNVVLNDEEKIGGNPVQPQDIEDFAFCINSCELEEVNFKGSPFTWWNGRADAACIFERLDRMLVNSLLLDNFGHIEVEHLARTGSNHAPLMCTYGDKHQKLVKPFKFLSFWIEHASFLDTVRQNWSIWEHDDPFINFKSKMKKLKVGLSKWSRKVFGDIFKQLIIREEIVRLKEQLFEQNPSQVNRVVLQKALAETKRYLHYEEEYWRQKLGMDWFVDGDKNTRFFHNLVKGRRKKLQIKRIKNSDGSRIEDEDQMADEAVEKTCWDIIGLDVYKMVVAFFQGHTLPKSVTHTNLVLLPKKELIQSYSNLRPISLSNFFNKVMSRVVHDRLESVLPQLISINQAGFVQGRSIIENVLLAQEIVTDIRKRGKPANVVIKLDMAKAYDRVSWLYLIKAKGFFHSTRGVKQGDPLSPSLFILSAEVLSRALNAEFDNAEYVGYEGESLKRIMKILQEYEAISGQLINKGKSVFYMHDKIAGALSQRKKGYYNDLIKKVKNKLQNWKGKLLSFGGKAVLINSVLQSIPIYMLSAVVPTKYTINMLHKIFARFYWSTKEEGKNRHWSSWDKICLPKEQGGLGFRSLEDVSKALFAKLWRKFRTSNTLWSAFMWNKYCKKKKPTEVQWKGGSQVWKRARDQVDHQIWWEPKNGACDVWEDNWTKLGPLKQVIPPDFQIDISIEEVSHFMNADGWDAHKLHAKLPINVCDHILQQLSIVEHSEDKDKAWWMPSTTGDFTVGSAWNMLRRKAQTADNFSKLWHKGVPFKISFFFWRLWKFKLPVDDVLKRMNISIVSRCRCCLNSQQEETIQHLFLTGDFAADIWQHYNAAVGIVVPRIQIHQIIIQWWYMQGPTNLKAVMQAAPAFICWQLWRRINTIMHGGKMNKLKVIHGINNNLQQLVKTLYPWLRQVPDEWPQLCNTDGASRGNPGLSSAAFCIRDEVGNLIYAGARRIADTTNITAESVAILDGIEFCIKNDLVPVMLESDSLSMINIIQGRWEIPWKISMEVNKINFWRNKGQVQFAHILREGNALADFLANLVFDFTGTVNFHSFAELPTSARKILNADKMMMPNFRTKIYRNREPD
ncbi:uncharacterized protein LOC132639487 [Lycium barbarum]|uniref:uncharacterized protein LOC132639487 n=1 Tax=Lycium barbarum TaxID=112863 RepID=UPI00293F0D87|nr:uncharacterized protein LOC132639487 [Lycium barbarum]